MATRGSYVHNSMEEFSWASQKFQFYAIFSESWWFQTKRFTGLLELLQLYKQDPLEKFFILTIFQNYTLALMQKYIISGFYLWHSNSNFSRGVSFFLHKLSQLSKYDHSLGMYD